MSTRPADALWELIGTIGRGALVTLKRDGRPQLSTIDYVVDPATRIMRISTVDGLAKVGNLRRDPRASLYVTRPDGSAYVVAEGTAELTAPSADVDDAVVAELVELYRSVKGEHPDWREYREAMVADHRLVVRLRIDRVYGWVPEAPPAD